jgi:hypothetical protein
MLAVTTLTVYHQPCQLHYYTNEFDWYYDLFQSVNWKSFAHHTGKHIAAYSQYLVLFKLANGE